MFFSSKLVYLDALSFSSLFKMFAFFSSCVKAINFTGTTSPTFPVRGVYMWKFAPVRVWYRYDIVISYRIYMKGYFLSTDVLLAPYWIEFRRLLMHNPFQTPRRGILNDIGTSFRTSPRCGYRGELAPVWLAPVEDFVLVSCKRIQSHKRKLEWPRTGMKVAPVSCKHPLIVAVRRLSAFACTIKMFWLCGISLLISAALE